MTRWIQGIIWVTGSCVLSCPLCLCMSGGGSWWVCACSVGLISITMLSGYATWSFISQLLNDSSSCIHYFSRFIVSQEESILTCEKSELPSSSTEESSFLEKEISITAQSFHSHLVLPWYSYISPDDKYSLQIRSTLEDLLTGVFKNLRQHAKLTVLFQHVLTLYIQHYRQFYRALKKVSQKLKKRPVCCVSQTEEIGAVYKPIHNALKSSEGIDLHFKRLAHLLLINYLPMEITRCNLLFICLKDLFAQNILHTTLDMFCDTRWLNETLASALESKREVLNVHKHIAQTSNAEGSNDSKVSEPGGGDGVNDERTLSYTHSLSAIREETSIEVLDTEIPWEGMPYSYINKKLNGTITRKGIPRKNSMDVNCEQRNLNTDLPTSSSEKDIENTHALLQYVHQSSSLEKDSQKMESKRSVATALGDLISTTTIPLLPEAATFPAVPTKMWESPMEEEMKPVTEGKKNLFKGIIVEGMTEETFEQKAKTVAAAAVTVSEKNLMLSPGAARRIAGDLKFDQSDLHRSKSLSNLPDETNETGELITLSNSSEMIGRAWSSADDNVQALRDQKVNGCAPSASRKGKGALRKMNSFDKSDCADDFSLESSSPPLGDSLKQKAEDKGSSTSHSSSSSVTVVVPSLPDESEEGNQPVRPAEGSLELSLSPSGEMIMMKEFGWENPDLSPIYEESENLASTIAKLRCLLSERQSQHSLGSQSSFGSSESEPKSAQSDPGRYNSLERTSRFTFLHKDSSGSLASVKSNSSSDSATQWHCGVTSNEEDLLEAAELPVDGKLFVNITIPNTQVHSESPGFQYTLYIIQYDAIYLCEVPPSTYCPGTGDSSTSETIPQGGLEHKMVLQTNFVKRRFREFLTLHSALEEDPVLRGSMKGVKGPNKWLNLPFSKLDSATISSRKQFLEKYLQALIHRPAINTSAPLKDFLAYGSDSSLAFVKKPLEIHVPRLDKLLARTVSGVFHSIKTALPNFDPIDASVQCASTAGPAGSAGMNSQALAEGSSSALSKANSQSFDGKDRPQAGGGVSSSASSFHPGDFDIRLDITSEEQVCEMEGTLLTAITSTSELNSPIEKATEAQYLNTGSENSKSLSSSSSSSSFPRSISFLPKVSSIPSSPPSSVVEETSRNNYSTFPCSPNPLASFWTEIGFSRSGANPLWREESQDSYGQGDGDFEDHHPLFLALVDTLVEIIGSTDHPITRQGATILITRIWAQPITHIIQSKLDRLLSEDLFEAFFSRIRNCIANIAVDPSVKSSSSSSSSKCSSSVADSSEEDPLASTRSKEKLRTTLKDLIPNIFELVLGSDSMTESLTLFVESLQHPDLNKDLGLHLIDLIFVHLLLPV